MAEHAHDWQPLDRWPGRYRCGVLECGVLGYRGTVVALGDDASARYRSNIHPYICTVIDCRDGAIEVRRRPRRQRCRSHA